jgi:acetyl esterase/lipase
VKRVSGTNRNETRSREVLAPRKMQPIWESIDAADPMTHRNFKQPKGEFAMSAAKQYLIAARSRLLLTFCSIALCAGLASAQSAPALPPAKDAQTLHYDSGPLQFGKLRLPNSADQVPVVIVVHGGCWADHLPGNHPPPDYSLMEPLSSALTSGGVATWNIEYRRAGSPGGGWPNTYLDLAKAVDYLRKIAAQDKLDLSRVFVVGHSSGGQLALWLGARPKLPGTSPLHTSGPLAIKEIIDIDGPPDLTAAQPLESEYCPMPAVTQFMGGTPAQQRARYHDGSVAAFLPLNIPQIILSGGLLQHVGTLAVDYQSAARSKGDSVTIIAVDGGHFDLVNPSSKPGQAVVAEILRAVNPNR